jgi:hypothetical protein
MTRDWISLQSSTPPESGRDRTIAECRERTKSSATNQTLRQSHTHCNISQTKTRRISMCTNRRLITQRGRGASDWETPTDLGCRGRIHCWATPHSRFPESKHYRSHRGVDPAKIRVLSQVREWVLGPVFGAGFPSEAGPMLTTHHYSLPLSTALHPPLIRIYGPIIRTFR